MDWDCEVIKNYSDINLGCARRPATGITWVFEQVEEAIILEDDCLPTRAFFQYAEEMLERYRDDERIMMITGTNFLEEWKSHIQSYHFSYYGGSWGWASWRRAWQYFDYELKLWNKEEIRERVRDVLANEEQFRAREAIYWKTYNNINHITWWDYQWGLARLIQSGLSIIPAVNLVTNIGFGKDATHTNWDYSDLSVDSSEFKFPIQMNEFVAVDREFDRQLYNKLMKPASLAVRVQKKLCKFFNNHSNPKVEK